VASFPTVVFFDFYLANSYKNGRSSPIIKAKEKVGTDSLKPSKLFTTF